VFISIIPFSKLIQKFEIRSRKIIIFFYTYIYNKPLFLIV